MKRYIGILAVILGITVLFSACLGRNEDGEQTSDGTSAISDTSTAEYDYTENTSASTETLPVTDISTVTSVLTEATEETTQGDPIDNNNTIVQTAEALIGISFAENGASPSEGFDNSGFIYYVLRQNGFINCPRLTKDQASMGTHIGYEELKSGDLAFFCTADSGNPDFGGIYIGEGQMIYSPMPGQTVKIADITSDYWKGTFVTGISLS